MYLRLTHLKSICEVALFNHKSLAYLYNAYINKNKPVENASYNYEQDEFISILYHASLTMPRLLENELDENYFLKYDKLSELNEFIFQIKYLEKKQWEYLKQHSPNSFGKKFTNLMLTDSILIGIYQNQVNKICTISFSNVVTYGDKRLYKNRDVNITDIAICFKNVSSVRIQGTFRYEPQEFHYISASWLSKESDTAYCFSVLSPIDKDAFMIEVVFTDYVIDIKPYSYYTKNCLPILSH